MNLSASLAPSADGTFRKDFSTSVRAHELGPTPTSNSADKVSRAGAGTLRNPAIARFPIPAGMIGERTSRRGSNLLNPLHPRQAVAYTGGVSPSHRDCHAELFRLVFVCSLRSAHPPLLHTSDAHSAAPGVPSMPQGM